ncbi:TPA: hypothetical protein MCW73_001728 [Klebsiella pneumoniae]|jgi:peptidoglycan hydrolase CwlO-like protein|uniref:hypothetical protein n=1 Tax=Klebsiella pneumoniae TaxID=573 RepID=UPI000C778F77|nr:hypothetical protein [Klebsiella pneumoniae]HBQ3197872.1 hypothetical protein [Klebsiella variicola subsp. variicola]HBQ5768364.1 hypothetical protein [Klebsiella pneumoniae subsp. pneumoniae]MBX4804457.1 hypothetical protein [Klebsiella pneumoniae]MBZ1871778.1 hypothetical protein [Klebsiella pneumoniae]MBZ6914078.1 hypothetical protein [Klebsiella pneumoniae]
MFKKLLKEAKNKTPSVGVDELVQLLDDIDETQKKISEEKEKFKKERQNGARATKHRFTV